MDYIDTVLIGQAAARAAGSGAAAPGTDAAYWKAYSERLMDRVADLQAQLAGKEAELQAARVSLLRKSAENNARKIYGRTLLAEINACPHQEHHALAKIERHADGTEQPHAAQVYAEIYEAEIKKAGA